jgi:hypothetical protein
VLVSFYRKRQSDIVTYYSVEGEIAHRNNIQESMEKLQLEHTSGQWRLVVDSSKVSLKEVLLHNGNKLIYPNGSYSSRERNIRETSGFAAKNTL